MSPFHAVDAAADALAAEALTPKALETIDQAVIAIRAGRDPHQVLRLLVAMSYMDGLIAMSKVGIPQS